MTGAGCWPWQEERGISSIAHGFHSSPQRESALPNRGRVSQYWCGLQRQRLRALVWNPHNEEVKACRAESPTQLSRTIGNPEKDPGSDNGGVKTREADELEWILQESPVGTKNEGSFEGQWGRKDLVGLQANGLGVGRVLRPPLRPPIQQKARKFQCLPQCHTESPNFGQMSRS